MAGREVEPHRRLVFGATGGLVSDRESVCLRRCYLGMGEKDDKVSPRRRTSPRHIGHTIRVAGTLHNGAILVSKAEMDNNGSSAEVKLSGMM